MISQPELIGAITIELDRQGVKEINSRQLNAIIEAANEIISECEKPTVLSSPGMTIKQWLASDDWGLSSRYMMDHITERHIHSYAFPHDADDFGRCVRLLENVVGFKPEDYRIMKGSGKEWDNLVDVWPQALEAYKAKRYHECTDIIQKAIRS